MAGANWIRFRSTAVNPNNSAGSGGMAFNLDVHDASLGTFDSWIFYGDSITQFAWDAGSYGSLINAQNSAYFPAATNAGFTFAKSSDAIPAMSRWLPLFPGKYVGLAFGTNDAGGATPTEFYNNMKNLIDQILAANKIPVLPTIPWVTDATHASQINTLNGQIAQLKIDYAGRVLAGPDLWATFLNQSNLLGDGLHPNAAGNTVYRQAWATKMAPIYTGTPTPQPPTISSFSASPSTITTGSSSTLSWSVSNATSLSISQGIGTVTGTTRSVSPTVTTTYTLTATNSAGSVTATTTVTVSSAVNNPPVGSFDEIRLSDGVIRGWTYDPDASSTSNDLHIYIDGAAGAGGTLLTGGPTTVLRSDVNSAFSITGNHGVEFTIPSQYRNGVSHSVYLYGIDSTNPANATLLSGSPKSFTLSATTPPPTPPTPPANCTIDESILPNAFQTCWSPGISGGIPADNDSVRPATVWLPTGNPYNGYSVNPALTGTANAAAFSSAFQAAINSAGAAATPTSRKIVKLKAGSYFVNPQTNSGGQVGIVVKVDNVTIRGEGAQTTHIIANGTINDYGTVILFGHRTGTSDASFAVQNVTASALRGNTTITVANASSYTVGDIITIDKLDGSAVQNGNAWLNGGYLWFFDGIYFKRQPTYSWNGPSTGAPNIDVTSFATAATTAQNAVPQWRSVGQETEITAINGNVITIKDPINIDFPLSTSPQVWRTIPVNTASTGVGTRWVGLEDVRVAGGNNMWGFPGGNIALSYTAYSWVKGVEADGERWSSDPVNHPGKYGYNIGLARCYRCVVRESYAHGSTDENPGGQAYGIVLGVGTAASLVENNISVNNNKPITFNATGGGNVISYNYVDQAVLWNSAGWLENGIDDSHLTFPHHDLIEGNWSPNIGGDSTHGNSGWETHIRNYAHGNNLLGGAMSGNLRAVGMDGWTHDHSYIGNVLNGGTVYQTTPSSQGGRAVYQLGNNSGNCGCWDNGYAAAHIYRDGNWDNVNNGVVWAAGAKTIPLSFYLTSKPWWFGNYTWPWIEPTASSAASRVMTLPAKARFDAGTPFALAPGAVSPTPTPTPPPPSSPAISSFTASPTSIASGGSSTLSWTVTNATTLSLDQGIGTVTGTTRSVSPTATTTYILTATNASGSVTSTATVTVTNPTPTISSFVASPTTITQGGASTLSWTVTNATSLSINQGIGTVTGTTRSVSPTATTTYILTATNASGSVTANTTVTVNIPPTVTISASPTSINQGQSSTLTWSSTNATTCTASGSWTGTGATSGTLVVTPNATATYTLTCTGPAGTTQPSSAVVTVTALPPLDFTMSNGGSKTVNQGSVVTNTVTSTLSAGATAATVTYTASGLPAGASAVFAPTSCTPTCTTTVTITTTGSTPIATSTLTITGTGGAVVRSTTFNLTVVDATPPTVSVSAPTANSTVSGSSVTLSATATDNVGVAGVQFKVDGVNVGAEDTSAPFTGSWNTTSASDTIHTVTAVARDSAGNITTSASVSVTVNNVVVTPPPPSAPVLSNVAVVVKKGNATITWTTNILATSQVEYGATSSYGSLSALNSTPVTSHTRVLSGLTSGTYNYRALSTTASVTGNSSNSTFVVRSKPPKPSGLTATAGSVILSWVNPTFDGFAGVSITRSTTGFLSAYDPAFEIATTTSNGYTDTNTVASTTYYYSIFVFDDQDNYSDPLTVSFTTPTATTPPPSPTPPGPPPPTTPPVIPPATPTPPPASGSLVTAALYPSGTIFKYANNPTVYIKEGVLARPITDWSVYVNQVPATRSIIVIPDSVTFPLGEVVGLRNATLIKASNNPTVFLIIDGEKFAFSSAQEFFNHNYNFSNVYVIDDIALVNRIPMSTKAFVRPSGTLFKYSNSPAVYFLNGARQKRGYTTLQMFNIWNATLKDVVTIPAGETYPDGPIANLPNGILVKGSAPTIYFVFDGVLRPFNNTALFDAMGLKMDQVKVFTDPDIQLHSVGGEM
ncbi:MAG: hypothetical protein KW804_00375 [Candidatus Doudnabacteria bacterium]|nr:hypothetical protein [Candidatus Doudnabacteria bacterium]